MLIAPLLAFLVPNSCTTPEQPKEKARSVYLMTIAASPTDGTVAVATTDGSLWFVDTSRDSPLRRAHLDGGAISSLIFAPDGKTIAAATTRITEPGQKRDNTVTWSTVKTDGTAEVTRLQVPEPVGLQARFRPHGTSLYLFNVDGGLCLVHGVAGTTIKLPGPAPHRFTAACWWGDGKVVTGDSNGVIRVWAADSGTMIESLSPLPSKVDCIAISLDDKQLLITSGPKARVCRLPDMTLQSEFTGSSPWFVPGNDGLFDAAWSRDRLLIASGTWYLIECRRFDGSLAWTHDLGHGDEATLVCSFDPSGKFACCARNGGVEGLVFDAEAGTQRTEGVLATSSWDVIEWTPDGRSVAMLHRSAGSVTIADTSSFMARRVLRLDEKGELVEATRR